MLADTQLFVLWIVFAALPFWLLPPDLCAWRMRWLTITSVALIFALAPYAALYVAWIYAVCLVFCRKPPKEKHSSRLALGLVLVCLPLLSQRLIFIEPSLLHTLGITFATLRGAALIFDNYTSQSHWPPRQIALTLFFVPLYTVGPVEQVATFNDKAFARSPDWLAMLRALSRCCLGLFKTVFIAEQLIRGYLDTHFAMTATISVSLLLPVCGCLLH